MISQILDPPADVIARIQPSAKLSTFLASVYAASLTDWMRAVPSTSVLVPRNDGFESLGLITSYLLLSGQDSRKALRRVLKYHLLQELLYSTDLSNVTTPRMAKTQEGSALTIEATKPNAESPVQVRESGPWNRTSILLPRDELINTGVIHEVKDVLIPSSVRITIGDLVEAADGETMRSLIVRAGLGKLLNGTLTMEDVDDLDDWKRKHQRPNPRMPVSANAAPSMGWVLLCPKDSAFSRVNLTRLLNDAEALRALVLQHIIPITPSSTPNFAAELPLSYLDAEQYTTLLSPSSLRADLAFRVVSKPGLPNGQTEIFVGIHGARGTDGVTDVARVLNYGRTIIPDSDVSDIARSGVLQIDAVLEPWVPDWWNAWGKAVSGGILGGLGIVAFWTTLLYFWRRHDEEPTYEPLDGAMDEDD
jgi:solute carrier family 25 carnitine/acylcarnitine transporter 20/29